MYTRHIHGHTPGVREGQSDAGVPLKGILSILVPHPQGFDDSKTTLRWF